MSLRNINGNIAISKINELFMLHKYDECVLLINRLNHMTLKTIVAQLPIDSFLARLPYTIEIFEALYSKMFIIDPEYFPSRQLMPERLLDKMVSYFSLLADEDKLEPIDGLKIIDLLENVIRVISYVQPNLYSKLLYFKNAIDNSLDKLAKEPTDGLQSTHLSDQLKNELQETILKCEKAQQKLSHYLSEVKSKKLFKDAQFNGKKSIEIEQSEALCQSYIQTRLFLNKSLMNSIETHLKSIKIHHILENVNKKIELDKEILLVYSNIKHEEKHLRPNEPLQPFLKRYSLGYERVIQIWRKKCSADNLFIPSASHNSLKKSLFDVDSLTEEELNKNNNNSFKRRVSKVEKSVSEHNIFQGDNRSNYGTIPVRVKKFGIKLVGLCEEDKNCDSIRGSTFEMSLAANTIEIQKIEIEKLKRQLSNARDLINKLKKTDERQRSHSSDELMDRAEHKTTLIKCDLVEIYEDFYQKNYKNTLNSLNFISELSKLSDLKIKLLFSIIVLSFYHVDLFVKEIKKKIRGLLQMENSSMSFYDNNTLTRRNSQENRYSNDFIESSLQHYLKSTCKTFDLSRLNEAIREQLWTTMCEYPSLKENKALASFTEDSLRLAWIITNQEPNFKIDYSSFKYDNSQHICLENNGNRLNGTPIVQYVWPILFDKLTTKCLSKGIVICS